MVRKFPKGFSWGAATSAHQIEGDNLHSDWWKAEQEGRVPHKSGRACDSYHRYEEDFDLAKSMHNNAHRFSIEWARIEPEEGKFDDREIEHYRQVIRAVKKRGMEPFVTLHHFTNPQWFAEQGGWANKRAPEHFERYVEYVVERLGEEATYWLTFNEPMMVLMHGYIQADWPPKKRSLLLYVRGLSNLLSAHRKAHRAIHKRVENGRVGASNQITPMKASGWNPLSWLLMLLADSFWNKYFFYRTKDACEFIGLHYYHVDDVRVGLSRPSSWIDYHGFRLAEGRISDMGWGIYPRGMYEAVIKFKNWGKPLYILENGIADEDDDRRPEFIQEHLRWLHKAIEEGADVRGYFHWSLLDNFEWAEGFTKRFGLVHVDFQTFKRTPRESARLYGEICKTNSL